MEESTMNFRTLVLLATFALAGCATGGKVTPPEESGKTAYTEDDFSESSGSARSDEEMEAMNGMDKHDPSNYSADSGQGSMERMPSSKKDQKKIKKKKTKKHGNAPSF